MVELGVLSGIAFPVLLIAVAAVGLPFLLTPRRTRSQRRLTFSVVLSALGLFLLGGALFAVLYQVNGSPMFRSLATYPAHFSWFLITRAALATVIWAPLLGLAWLSLSRRIEQAKAIEGMSVKTETIADGADAADEQEITAEPEPETLPEPSVADKTEDGSELEEITFKHVPIEIPLLHDD